MTAAAKYLDGNFAPVATEVTAADLEVTGAVPPGLAGRYIRTGPNPFAAQADTYHWFAGDGMVHGVDPARRPATLVPQPLGAQPRGERALR